MSDNPFGKEMFPSIQSELPLKQLEAGSSCPSACYVGEETNVHLTTSSFQEIESSKVPLSLLFSRLCMGYLLLSPNVVGGETVSDCACLIC